MDTAASKCPDKEGGINETPQRGMGRAFPVRTQHTPMPSLYRSRFDAPLSMYLPDGSAYTSDWYDGDNFDETLSRTFPGSELMTENNTIQATHELLNAVWREFLHRQRLPRSTRTVFDLMRQLVNRCSVFRLLDLPPELREAIYDMALGESEDYSCCIQGHHRGSSYDVDRVLAITSSEDESHRTGIPPLLHVSRQVRSEAGKVYFGRKNFQICIDTVHSETAQEDVNVWLKTIVGSFATHLTDVRVHFHCDHGGKHGYRDPRQFLCMSAYVAALEENRIAGNQKGEVIRDLFCDWDALNLACFGPKQKRMTLEGVDGSGGPDWTFVDCESNDPDGELWDKL